ncbi:THUMP domain-containing class I SAM-dependent RNA methyltransferase [Usitatibacter palustris]|uniref:Ribosomal RNA large subunit methyltransferase L n=1 Tax=Usitatibacter palustris TaxID=2732487 RepID=A0A6M4HFF1_9PROT|nr:class I SAM-dependent RNA methyltransferase [Usitatibacter palustris]QJR16767.1 Ribosomal RNA large subunit methyltransferase L [Usitatibacter palustris]
MVTIIRKKAADASTHFYATCPRGLSEGLAEELKGLGATEVRVDPAGVAFEGDLALAYAANLHSRLAARILWRQARFEYTTEQDIYEGAKRVRWHAFFGIQQTFKVEVAAVKSPVKSLDFVTLRIKDAIVDQFREAMGKRPSVESHKPDVRVHAFLDDKWCTLYLDTSGEPLFKRGKRDHVGEAPLKKNLAAGILRMAGWKPGMPLLDPMCGSGTFLSEAAEMTFNWAPGRGREFGFEKLTNYDAALWEPMREAAAAQEKPLTPLPIFGSDLYGRSVDNARGNLVDAGLETVVSLKQVNILEMSAPAPEGIMVTNPPYGVRLGEKEELAKFYPEFGNLLKQKFSGWNCYILTADMDMPKVIRLKATKRTVLYNGALECRLFEYKIVAGGNR